MAEKLGGEHKEVLYFLSLQLYSSTRLAVVRGQFDLAGTPVFGGILENRKEAGQGRRDPAGEQDQAQEKEKLPLIIGTIKEKGVYHEKFV